MLRTGGVTSNVMEVRGVAANKAEPVEDVAIVNGRYPRDIGIGFGGPSFTVQCRIRWGRDHVRAQERGVDPSTRPRRKSHLPIVDAPRDDKVPC